MAVISLESNPNCFLNILSCIQDLGIVIWCDEENTYISSYTAFGDLYEGPLPTNPIEPIELIPCALLNTEDDNIITAENENGILTEGLCDGQSTTTSKSVIHIRLFAFFLFHFAKKISLPVPSEQFLPFHPNLLT